LVWSGDPDGYLTAERQLPPDWSAIGERTYCPRCSRDDPLPHRVAADQVYDENAPDQIGDPYTAAVSDLPDYLKDKWYLTALALHSGQLP
jgi:hypothetical protein